jgi:hypothetical protein
VTPTTWGAVLGAFTGLGIWLVVDRLWSARHTSLAVRVTPYLRDDARTRSEMESRQAWTVNGARLAVAAPWLVLLVMSLQSEVIRRYASPAGVVVLTLGAALCAVAYWSMMRIGRLPVERRILG